jgi:hypothetical protein
VDSPWRGGCYPAGFVSVMAPLCAILRLPRILDYAMTTLSDDDILLVTRALEHYNAYLLATQRHDPRYLELAERLKRKPPEAVKRPVQRTVQGKRA